MKRKHIQLVIAVLAAAFLLMPPGAQAAVTCAVPQAPVISVDPVTEPVQYDFSRSEAELTATGTDTVSPYAPGADAVTSGKTVDMPVTSFGIEIAGQEYPGGVICAWYKTVNIRIKLQPVIYVAREKTADKTCRDEILKHEQKHVAVSRAVFNAHARAVGQAVQRAVNEAGAVGPFNAPKFKDMQDMMKEHIASAIRATELATYKDLAARQGEIDSLDEYSRVSAICQTPKGGKRKKR